DTQASLFTFFFFSPFETESCSVTQEAHCSLCLPGSRYSLASASQVDGITDAQHHAWLIILCVFLVETGFHHVGQADFKLLISSDLPASASRSARITGFSHYAWPSEITLDPPG
uniref:Uncharacterized protein n=1 Tax=Callithrix jacchus TaxID=9483 RepID=A0A8I3ZYF0_CALJA